MKTEPSSLRACVFFDRDGIVNRSPGPGYVEHRKDFHLLPDFVKALRVTHRKGYPAVIVSNQRGIATGRIPEVELEAMHQYLQQKLSKEGLRLLDILICPHERNTCSCRKPLPGLLLMAADRHQLDLTHSWMIGDHGTDVQAGRAAGCHTILVRPEPESPEAEYHIRHMSELPNLLEQVLPPVSL